MKIKYQIILLLTAIVMLFAGCGKKNTVVTGRYYYPDQEKDAKTEETSDDAGESVETTEENEAVIGSDQFLIKTNDMQEECLTLEQIASGKEYVYYYTLATRFLDKYGNRTAVSYFEPGRVITVGERMTRKKSHRYRSQMPSGNIRMCRVIRWIRTAAFLRLEMSGIPMMKIFISVRMTWESSCLT